MGLCAAQLVRDAREHGVEIRPADVNFSDWDNTLEADGGGYRALRLGFPSDKGLSRKRCHRADRRADRYRDPADIETGPAFRCGMERLERCVWLNGTGTTGCALGGTCLPPAPHLFEDGEHRNDPDVSLPAMAIGEEVTHDYANLRLSLKTHPLALLREELAAARVAQNERLAHTTDGTRVTVAGIALVRQRPAPPVSSSSHWRTKRPSPTLSSGRRRSRDIASSHGRATDPVTGKLQRKESSSMSLQTIWKI